MNEQPIVNSKFPFGLSIVLILVGIGILKFVTFLGQRAFQEEYLQLTDLFLVVFLGIYGIACIATVLIIPKFEIYKDRLEIKSIWGTTRKIIYRNEIISWAEKPKQLTIFTNQTKHKIYSVTCRNFDKIKNELTKETHRNTNYEIESKERETKIIKRCQMFQALAYFLLGCFLFFCVYRPIISKNTDPRSEQLTSIKGIITNVSRIGDPPIMLRLLQYPNFTFNIDGNKYYATYVADFISKINAKDTITIDILTDEYEKKITQDRPMSFFDKRIDYRFISIYGLRTKENTLLSSRDYNNEKKSDKSFILVLLGVFFCGLSLYQFKLNK